MHYCQKSKIRNNKCTQRFLISYNKENTVGIELVWWHCSQIFYGFVIRLIQFKVILKYASQKRPKTVNKISNPRIQDRKTVNRIWYHQADINIDLGKYLCDFIIIQDCFVTFFVAYIPCFYMQYYVTVLLLNALKRDFQNVYYILITRISL